ncbi:hypothetical protein LINPERHAP1_LOCUS28929, partial [Linum perenne]
RESNPYLLYLAINLSSPSDLNNNGRRQPHLHPTVLLYLTKDIVINILLCLSIALCIARFRYVCRSWMTLLIDPNFVHKILFSQKFDNQKSMQILFSGARGNIMFPPYLILYTRLKCFNQLQQIWSQRSYKQTNIQSVVEGCCTYNITWLWRHTVCASKRHFSASIEF